MKKVLVSKTTAEAIELKFGDLGATAVNPDADQTKAAAPHGLGALIQKAADAIMPGAVVADELANPKKAVDYHDFHIILNKAFQALEENMTGGTDIELIIDTAKGRTFTIFYIATPNASFTVNWGDGAKSGVNDISEGKIIHTYSDDSGLKTIRIVEKAVGLSGIRFEMNNSLITVNKLICPMVTDFSHCFDGCRSLAAIPAGLFEHCPDVTTFSHCFSCCDSLAAIPDDLFHHCPKVTDFTYCFNGCISLAAIPAGLFSQCPAVITFNSCFQYCVVLTAIPEGLFDHCPAVTDFSSCFAVCLALISIPAGLFDHCSAVTKFKYTFLNCTALRAVPSGLFDHCPNVLDFTCCFYECASLATVPANLFDQCTKVTMFVSCFATCEKLTFAPTLWLTHASAIGLSCFVNCAKASNYNSIPANWR